MQMFIDMAFHCASAQTVMYKDFAYGNGFPRMKVETSSIAKRPNTLSIIPGAKSTG